MKVEIPIEWGMITSQDVFNLYLLYCQIYGNTPSQGDRTAIQDVARERQGRLREVGGEIDYRSPNTGRFVVERRSEIGFEIYGYGQSREGEIADMDNEVKFNLFQEAVIDYFRNLGRIPGEKAVDERDLEETIRIEEPHPEDDEPERYICIDTLAKDTTAYVEQGKKLAGRVVEMVRNAIIPELMPLLPKDYDFPSEHASVDYACSSEGSQPAGFTASLRLYHGDKPASAGDTEKIKKTLELNLTELAQEYDLVGVEISGEPPVL